MVMDPEVIRANNNYPFKTGEEYVWFIAIEDKEVVGFVPVEQKSRKKAVINKIVWPFQYIKVYFLSAISAILCSVTIGLITISCGLVILCVHLLHFFNSISSYYE